ncbi:MAG: hypothetical protein QM756_14170 [Polyangiaceae bacterium]
MKPTHAPRSDTPPREPTLAPTELAALVFALPDVTACTVIDLTTGTVVASRAQRDNPQLDLAAIGMARAFARRSRKPFSEATATTARSMHWLLHFASKLLLHVEVERGNGNLAETRARARALLEP